MSANVQPSARLIFVALFVIQLLFGVNYVVSKVVVTAFQPMVWGSLRMIIAAILMTSAAILLRRPAPTTGARFYGPMILWALLGVVINQSAFLVGLRYTTSTNSAILNTLTPIITLLIVSIRGLQKITPMRLGGFLLALLGVLLVRKIEDFNLSDKTFIGDVLMIVNCVSLSLFFSFGKPFLKNYDQIWVTAWMFIYGATGITLLALPDWANVVWPVMTLELWGACAFAIFGATIATYFLNNWALKYANPFHVSLFIYVQPVIASLLAWGAFGEVPTLRTGVASGLIFMGIILTVLPEKRMTA